MPVHLNLEVPWPEVKEKLKEIDFSLTDEDLEYVQGQETALLERLAAKMGRSVSEVKEWIESVSFNRDIAS